MLKTETFELVRSLGYFLKGAKITSQRLRRIMNSLYSRGANHVCRVPHPDFSAPLSKGTFCACAFAIGGRKQRVPLPRASHSFGLRAASPHSLVFDCGSGLN